MPVEPLLEGQSCQVLPTVWNKAQVSGVSAESDFVYWPWGNTFLEICFWLRDNARDLSFLSVNEFESSQGRASEGSEDTSSVVQV